MSDLEQQLKWLDDIRSSDEYKEAALDNKVELLEEEITRLRAKLAEVEGQEPVAFTCHGNSAPAYSCNKPGDMSGMYYRNPAPAKVPDELIKAIATTFFRQWYNAPGANTDQGFDDWWRENREAMLKSQGRE